MRYLGIDYGFRKIGLAISEGQIASVYGILEVANTKEAGSKVKQIIKEEGIDRVVVGMPEGEIGKRVKVFINSLRKELKAKVIEADETLSSKDAIKLMLNLGIGRRERRKEDAYSAVIILQNFLDSLE